MANVASLRNKMIDITNDIQANASHHICVVETWLEMNKEYNLSICTRIWQPCALQSSVNTSKTHFFIEKRGFTG